MQRTPSIIALVLAVLYGLLLPGDLLAQEQTYTLALRGVALDDAIERFVGATGTAVSYAPALVQGESASCAAEDEEVETVLACILEESGLDFYRLSSGTYVLTESVEAAPERGYLAGRVVDVETGSPLAGAHVELADVGIGAVTDRSGRFTLPALLPGPYAVSVSHLGYRPWSDSLVVGPREAVHTEAALQPEPIFITPVVVDGLQERAAFETLGRGRVTSSDAAATRAAPYRHLASLAGVRLGDVTADVHVQGGDPGAHQLRLDGVPVFLPWSLDGFVGPFGNLALERLTVHTAGYGAPHGSSLGGVVLAEHALSPTNDFDLQADPYSLNARLRLSSNAEGSRQATAMVSGRVGLWDVLTPATFRSTLDGWSRPDPFLILGSLGGSAPIAAPTTLFDVPANPSLHFSDLHAAGRLRFGPLRSLDASFYHGRQHLSGGVLPRESVASRQFAAADVTVFDQYAWTNRLGQVRYEAVLGSRTLAGLQARASDYRLENAYRTLDSLNVVLAEGRLRPVGLSTTPVRDQNGVSTFALEGRIDHALDRHQLQAGLEAGVLDSRFELQSVRFPASPASDRSPEAFAEEAAKGLVRNRTISWYGAAFGQDRIRLGKRAEVELGVRLTYLTARRSVYAEPRMAVVYRSGRGPIGAWTTRTSGGIYRQFLNQTDASRLNAGALLPAVRVWLPVDGSVRPPIAFHAAQEVLIQPSDPWALRLKAYLKHEPRSLAPAYAQVDRSEYAVGHISQTRVFTRARMQGYGASLGATWTSDAARAEVRYAVEHTRRRSDMLFDGQSHPVPWSEPHRLEVGVDWLPVARLILSARWKGVWKRPWGFRQVYYDYFGHEEATRIHPPFDLGDPASHVLPALYQLDLSAAYTLTVASTDVQLRADVVNAGNRGNVLDWRFIPGHGEWRREARLLYPRMASVAIRIHGP